MPHTRINIGFDFGTSTTKVCFYNVLEETHHFYVFYKNLNNIERYCKPSVIRFYEDKIYFNDLPYGKKIKLFKMGIPEKIYPAENPNQLNDFKAYQLVALYCGQLLKEVKSYLNIRYNNPIISINYGVPVDHISNSQEPDKSKEKYFRKAFGIACILADRNIEIQGQSAPDLINLLKNTEDILDGINNPDDLYWIYPETIAGTGALLLNNTLQRMYRYSIVDIGAGTTDISFFHFGEISDPEGCIYVYHSKTVDIGNEYNSSNSELAKEKLGETYKLGFGQSHYLCPKYWKSDFNLMYLGGGSLGKLKSFINNIELTIKGNKFHRTIITPKEIDFPIPENTFDAQNVDFEIWMNNFEFLAVCYGLSYPHEMLPHYNPQVPPPIHNPVEPGPDESLTPDVG